MVKLGRSNVTYHVGIRVNVLGILSVQWVLYVRPGSPGWIYFALGEYLQTVIRYRRLTLYYFFTVPVTGMFEIIATKKITV
jgi:hypothetical protein